MPRVKRFVCMSLLIGVAAIVTPAYAQPSAEHKAEARAKYEQGTKAFTAKRYKDALDLFLQADAIIQDPSFAYNAASAYEAMGDKENALRWSREYLRRKPGAPDEAEVQARIGEYQEHLRAKGVQQVTVMSDPSGATLLIDDQPVGVTPWTGELAPGKHDAVLRLDGYAQLDHAVELPADRAIDVRVTLEPEKEAPLPPDTAAVVATEDAGGPWLVIGVVTASVGVAALGGALGFKLASDSAEQDAFDAPDQLAAEADYDTAEDLQRGAQIAVGVGGGLLAIGIVFVVVGLGSGGEGDDDATAWFDCGGAGCGVRGRF